VFQFCWQSQKGALHFFVGIAATKNSKPEKNSNKIFQEQNEPHHNSTKSEIEFMHFWLVNFMASPLA
jgi:hypothetical protein